MALQNIQPFIFAKNCQTPDTTATNTTITLTISSLNLLLFFFICLVCCLLSQIYKNISE